MIKNEIIKKFPKGKKVVLVKMNDKYAPPVGTKGVVADVDDMGTIFVRWENGSGLGVVYGEDECLPAEDCCLCGKPVYGYGNNAQPLKDGICCDNCNMQSVIPYRIALMGGDKNGF